MMQIGEFSSRTGVSIDTLRYYEKIGLISPKRRNQQRFYGDQDLELILTINKLKQMNFGLKDIKKILYFDQKLEEGLSEGRLPPEIMEESLTMFKRKLQEVEEKEKELKDVKLLLRHIMDKITALEKRAQEEDRKGGNEK